MTEPTPRPVRIAVLTVSDTRTEATDRSGALLIERLTSAGHTLHSRRILPDDMTVLDSAVMALRADPTCEVVLATGGTASTIQSRASGGLAGTTLLFALPGSPSACALGWDQILAHQLDARSKPCNLVALMPRFDE